MGIFPFMGVGNKVSWEGTKLTTLGKCPELRSLVVRGEFKSNMKPQITGSQCLYLRDWLKVPLFFAIR